MARGRHPTQDSSPTELAAGNGLLDLMTFPAMPRLAHEPLKRNARDPLAPASA